MIDFCKANPEAVAVILVVLGTIIVGLCVTVLGLIKGWWRHSEHGNEAIWDELKEIKKRQSEMREKTLQEYVKVTALEKLEETWRDMAKELKGFMESCREGNCFAGQMLRRQGGKPG